MIARPPPSYEWTLHPGVPDDGDLPPETPRLPWPMDPYLPGLGFNRGVGWMGLGWVELGGVGWGRGLGWGLGGFRY